MKLKRERKGLIFIGMIAAIVVALVVIISIYAKQDKIQENLQQDPVIKVLFVLKDKNQALFTDVLIYYPVTGKGVLVNIPGNTGGLHPALDRVDRIDAIYSEKGIEAYRQAVSNFIKVDVPFYLETSVNNMVEMADLLGGFELFISMPVDARSSTEDKWLLPSGRVTLDGEKLRTFLTYHLDEDTESSIQERRQDATVAFLSAVKSNSNIYLNKTNFNQLSSRMTSNVKDKDLLELFQYISELDTERFEAVTVTGTNTTVDGKTLLMPFRNGEYIKDVVKKSINSIVSPSGSANARPYVIRILNGTKVLGLAHNTKILLEGAAFEVLDIGNTEGEEEVEETYIIDHIGQPEVAMNIGDFIHCTKVEEEEVNKDDTETEANVDFTLVLGKNFDGRWVRQREKK